MSNIRRRGGGNSTLLRGPYRIKSVQKRYKTRIEPITDERRIEIDFLPKSACFLFLSKANLISAGFISTENTMLRYK